MILTQSTTLHFLNLQLSKKETLTLALTRIFGINFKLAQQICIQFGFTKHSLLGDVPLELLNDIRNSIVRTYSTQQELKTKIKDNIQSLILNRSWRGLRHKLRLPVRGQRTRTNHKTQKNFQS